MALDLDKMIAEVEAKLHEVYLGNAVVRVRLENGGETEFSRANASVLEAYLSRLQARKAGQVTGGAIGFVFG